MNKSFPAARGSYLLWFYLPRGGELTVGRLGTHHFRRGWYLYCGSAFGPGGLRARLKHHLGVSEKKHWHVDYLKTRAQVRSVWFCLGANQEHRWSRGLAGIVEARYPLAGFGASDCDCCSHLIYFPGRPASARILGALGGETPVFRRNLASLPVVRTT